MNNNRLAFLPAVFFFITSCANHNKTNINTPADSLTAGVHTKPDDSAVLKSDSHTPDSATANSDTLPLLNGHHVKTDDFIKQYPAGQKTGFRHYMDLLRKEWQNVPNPITATYQGNEFGDYHHILFEAANGVTYDFGQANNNYGPYKLHELSGQYADNPKFLGKKFNIYWDWKLTDFLCCDGEYGKAKAYLPAITKLELIKN